MPLYEYRKNATNHISAPPSVRDEVVCGTTSVLERMLDLIRAQAKSGQSVRVALDGWYGVDWEKLQSGLRDVARGKGVAIDFFPASQLFKAPEEIDNYRRPFVTDDPSFGYVNSK